VTLSGSPGAAVTVDFATSVASGNTAAQSDFTNTTGSVTFASGATGAGLTKTFTVATTQDALAEGAETFTVTISGTLPGGITISDATGVGTINASDAATLSVNDSSANEGSNVSFTVTLSGSPGAAVTVDFATSVASGNTAVQADFTSTTGTVTFASGATGAGLTKTFTVAATDDALAEGAETFTVTISEPSGNFPPGISINDATGVGTINASDAATLSVNDSSANEGSNATFTVTLSGSPGAQVTVDFATSIASGNTAASSDFTSTTGTVTFAAEATGGGLTQTFTVATTDDARAEGAETFTVTISEPSSNFPPSISISDSTGTGTINASDPATLSVIDATGGEGANVTFTVNLSGSPDAAVTVDYATSIETGDTAAASDFTSTSGTLTFAAGATGTGLAKTFTVALTDDELVEGRETFTVTLTAPSGGFPPNISINDGTAEGAIDAKGSASLSVTDTSASEGGNLTFTVTLSARPGNEVTVNYATSIASGNTALQSDFTSTSGTVTIEAGARGAGLSQTFTVAATDDNLAEGPETFTVTLTEPSSNFPPGISLSKSTGTGTINASDPATLSVTDASGGEGGDLTFAVTLSGSPGADVIVDYATSTEFGDTAGSSDYTSTSGSLTFATGATGEALTQAITVPVSDDELVEGDEEFTMTMSAPAGGLPPNISISEGTSKGTITASGLAALSVSDASTGEGGRLTFTVALSASPADQVTVNYATSISSDDTASASDFESASGTLTFAAEASGTGLFKRFTVDTLHDGLVEGPETFTVTLSPPLGGFPAGVGISVRAGTSTGTIRSSGSATLSVNDAEGPEGSDLTFTVTLSASSASAVTVDYAAGIGPDDTASESDFESASGSLTFEAEATGEALSQTFTVAAIADGLAEGPETFTVTLSAPADGFPPGISIGDATGGGRIAGTGGPGGPGGPGGATLSVSDAEGDEGGDLTFTVTLSGSPGSAVTVDYATSIESGDTASESDFESTSGSLTFEAEATGEALSQTFTVAAVDDGLAEGEETFTVTLSAPADGFPPGVSIGDGTGTGTITGSGGRGEATLSVSDAEGLEGSDLTFTVTLSDSPTAAVTVDYATGIGPDDTASASDFESASGSVTFAADATGAALSQTFTVTTVADDLAEGDETFTVTLSAPSDGFPVGISIGDATGTGTITGGGSAELSVSDASGDEGGDLTFTVTLSGSPASAVTVDYATGIGPDDTASESDFESASGSLAFAANATGEALSQTFTVTTVADSLAEGDETFTVTLSAPSDGFPVGISIGDATGTGTITGGGLAELSVSDASGDEGGDLTFTVTLSDSPASAVTVDYATSVEPGDTASASDFESASGSLTFAANATGAALSRTFTVTTVADELVEGDETFTVTLSAPSGGFPPGVGIKDATGTGTITGGGLAELSVSDASGDEGGDLTFTVTLSESPASAVTVDYATAIGPDDTASESDFESASGSLTFAANATGAALSQTFAVAAVADDLVEGDETFTVTLSAPAGGLPPGVGIKDATGTGTIADTTPAVSTELSVSDAEGVEGGDLTFTVTLSGSPASEVTVDYATSIESGDTASASDFESASGSLTFAAGAAGEALSQAFTVAAVADDLVEGDETFTVTLSAPAGGLPSGVEIKDATGTGTITGGGSAELSVSDAEGDEGGDLTFTVTLSGSPASEVTVAYATSVESGDTASASDFESASGSLTFAAGAAGEALSQAFTVAAVADDLVEGDETFTVTLSAPAGGFPPGIGIKDATGKGTIAAAGSAELSVSDASGDEGGDLTFTVTLSGSPASAVAVEWATSIGSGDTASQSDFESAGASVVFAAGATGAALSRTFTVAAVADDLVEGDETFTVTLSVPSTGFPPGISIGDATGTGTIIGAGSAELSVSDAAGDEGGDLTFTVTLSASPGAPVTVAYATGIGSADTAAPSDFTSASGSLTFAAGSAGAALSQTFSVAVTDDELAEGAETFTVSLSQPSGARFPFGVSIADGTGTGTISASDAATVSISDAAGPEGSELTFAVSLSGSPGADVEVAYATAIQAGDTAGVDDFAPVNGTLRFAAGATGSELTRTFAVRTAADSRAEEDETFSVLLSETAEGFPAGIDLGDGAGVGTIGEDTSASGEARVGRVNEEVAPRLAQAVAASTLSAISGRIDAAATAGSIAATASTLTDETGLGGPFDPFNTPGSDWRYSDRALGGLSFAMPLESSESEGAQRRRAAIWGSGDYYRLSDTDDSMVEWDGDVLSFHVGADMRIRPDLLGGVSVSRTSGSIEYMDRTDDVAAGGRYDTQITSVNPYLSWSLPKSGLAAWATLGYGRGDVELDDDLAGRESSDMSMKTAAVGASGRLFSSEEMIAGGTTSLRLKGEGSVALLDIKGRGLISPLTSDVQRLRLALEGSYARTLDSGGMLTPSLELGVRHDGGDAVTGLGLELGGSLRYVETTIGLTVAGRGRVLVAHRDDDYEEWSVGGLVRLDPGVDRHGLALTLAPAWGDGAGGIGSFGRLYEQDEMSSYGRSQRVRQTGRVDAEIGYGLSGILARGVMTPFAGLVLTNDSSRRYRLGSYFEFADWLRFSAEAGREERGSRLPNHGVLLRAHLRW